MYSKHKIKIFLSETKSDQKSVNRVNFILIKSIEINIIPKIKHAGNVFGYKNFPLATFVKNHECGVCNRL